ncbi:serine/threonine-protein kinase [Gloeocapsopsis dulcis]|uniref:non-specific serine/threonine protein kinase n=1 Tax=Gloeocapsopsis dulcis AAB1 = 1H9 TaxID=1433147 RepID=A0A6N8FZJ8_9CHRO|nr:serine/threonine-protein kinase [Gloeocapsopsis dulcis]MUL38513.1 serine/threonine protein kinase [Gloeocapsopsis dulcis AAB1 = 1H9]WNN91625.1 serine/threonine protein kinase [Gloeocapsopsis dulcis]
MYCSQGHENPDRSCYCLQCGEKLTGANNTQPGIILGDRYRIIRQLGQGSFGRTYLAEDINRFNELCVLKEFAPQVQGTYALQKGQQLFQREAGVLYKLKHPQIPKFRELFQAHLDGKQHLLLVQDYVEGPSYRKLLNTRKQQGLDFSEAEITQLLLQILPVLEYIHSLGVIHRDISPDNIILRNSDYLPVIIDFGGVKQVAATIVSQFSPTNPDAALLPATHLGKIGYVPQEQISEGVSPQTDLYALAATALILLTGKESQELIDPQTRQWNWRQEINLSPNLGSVLDKMLMSRASDRYQSARQVLQALNRYAHKQPAPQVPTTIVTQPPQTNVMPVTWQLQPASVSYARSHAFSLGKVATVGLLLIAATGLSWWGTRFWLQSRDPITIQPAEPNVPIAIPTPQYSAAEQNRKNQLRDRRQQLGINDSFYNALVNQLFWEEHPKQQGKTLSPSSADEQLRSEWDSLAAESLNKLQALSPEARQQLGKYRAADREQWKVGVNKLNLSSRALYDLADATFFQLFPKYRGKTFINQPIGQVWHGLAADKLQRLVAGSSYEKIEFTQGNTLQQVRGTLQPGEGKAYITRLTKDQLMQLHLEANSQVLISAYSPTGSTVLLEDTSDRTWSGKLSETGYYEFVIVSTASTPADYLLQIIAD